MKPLKCILQNLTIDNYCYLLQLLLFAKRKKEIGISIAEILTYFSEETIGEGEKTNSLLLPEMATMTTLV